MPGHFRRNRQFSGVEAQSMYEHWETFIRRLEERGFQDEEIGMIVGGNFLRVMRGAALTRLSGKDCAVRAQLYK